MLSINPFVHTPRDLQIDSLNRIISVLLQGLALHSFCHDEGEFEDFQRSLRKLRDQFATADDDDSKLLLAGAAIRTLEEHSLAASRALATRQNELEGAIALLSDSLLTVSHASETQALELKESERDVALARQTHDMIAARERLTFCLEDIRIQVVKREQTPSLPYSDAGADIDTVTGLPGSRQAIDAIIAAWNRREDYNAAVFAVRRLDTINLRFGFEAGDEILRVMSGHLNGFFAATRLLFRWRGPYLLGLVAKGTAPRISAELQRFTAMKLQHSLTRKDREVILPVSMICALVPLQAKSIEDMIRSLDELTKNGLHQERSFVY
jgi:GGDEF domain-containing protein